MKLLFGCVTIVLQGKLEGGGANLKETRICSGPDAVADVSSSCNLECDGLSGVATKKPGIRCLGVRALVERRVSFVNLPGGGSDRDWLLECSRYVPMPGSYGGHLGPRWVKSHRPDKRWTRGIASMLP